MDLFLRQKVWDFLMNHQKIYIIRSHLNLFGLYKYALIIIYFAQSPKGWMVLMHLYILSDTESNSLFYVTLKRYSLYLTKNIAFDVMILQIRFISIMC